MVTIFIFIFGVCLGLLIGMGVWLAVDVSFNHNTDDIFCANPRDSEHYALPEET